MTSAPSGYSDTWYILSYRRLFPSAVVNVRGLNPRTDYTISLRARPIGKYRYKYSDKKEWVPSYESEVLQNKKKQVFLHPNSPNSGEFWMKKPVCFKQMKITHSSISQNGNVSAVGCAC